jgi:transposase-like protein
MKKRTFTPEFKASLVVELLKGEKDINALAGEHSIAALLEVNRTSGLL